MKLSKRLREQLMGCRERAVKLRSSSQGTRNAVLNDLASSLARERETVLRANRLDMARLAKRGSPAFADRLALDDKRVGLMIESLKTVAALPDPIGETVEKKTLANGLRIRRVRSPLGVILLIFESRPNVAVESFSLAVKSGNVIILRGGRESFSTTKVLYALMGSALQSCGLQRTSFWGITDPDRRLIKTLLHETSYIDIVVPRGGEKLIDFVVKNSWIPIIKNDRGLCHVYIHEDADLEMATRIVVNAKTQRPGVCNAMETLLVHSSVSGEVLPRIHQQMQPFGVRWRGCERTQKILRHHGDVRPASEKHFHTEYLDFALSCRVVDSLEDAIAHVESYGSRHSDAIVTRSEATARKFQAEVDSAVVYWNASTRFTDGFEFGLGGELGISTQKLHVRGPVGLRELTSTRWIIDGEGQVRG